MILLTIFYLDILVSFFVGYYDESGILIMDSIVHSSIVALHYLRCVSNVTVRRFFRGAREGGT